MHNIKSITQKDRHGNMFSLEMFEDQSVPMIMMIPEMANGFNGADTGNHPGKPKGTDTVPAWLTPGENVVNAEASRIPGNQEVIDQMNEQGRQMQVAQGGPVPTYQSHGGGVPPLYASQGTDAGRWDWVTDDLLDRIAMVESGGKHFQDDGTLTKSDAGALGKYQWMPKSAADPGFGVDPFDAATATAAEQREKTRQYLIGMSKYYPEWSQDDVLMAYNAGPGRIEDAKRGGWNPLTQETLDYVGKIRGVDFGNQTPPDLKPEDYIGASSSSVRRGHDAVMLNIAKKKLAEAQEKRQSYLEEMQDDKKAERWYGWIPGVDAYLSDEIPKLDSQIAALEAEVSERTGTADASKAADIEANKTSPFFLNQQEKVKQEQSINRRANEQLEKAGMSTEKPDTLTQATEKDALNSMLANTDDEPKPNRDGSAERAGLDERKNNPGFFKEATNLLTDTFKDMFSPTDIARMAISYVGSRALGYGHDGSLNYAMKDYADNKESIREQELALIKANAKNYTASSYANYIRTRDSSVLVPKGPETKVGDNLFVPSMGVTTSIDVEGVPHIYGDPDGDGDRYQPDLHNATLFGATKVNPDLHDPGKVQQNFLSELKILQDQVNKNVTDAEDKVSFIHNPEVASTMSDIYFDDLRRYGSDPNKTNRLKTAMRTAAKKWAEAMKDFKDEDTDIDPAKKLTAFYHNEIIDMRMGIDKTAFDKVDPQITLSLFQNAAGQGLRTDEQVEEYFEMAQGVYNYAKLNEKEMHGFKYDKKEFEGLDSDEALYGHNNFSWWLHNLQQAKNDKDQKSNAAVKLLNENMEGYLKHKISITKNAKEKKALQRKLKAYQNK